MTIAIKITNNDTRENAIVKVNRVYKTEKSLLPHVDQPGKELKGGESILEYVHSGQSIVVEEIQNG